MPYTDNIHEEDDANTFSVDVMAAFLYPVRGSGVITILIGALFYGLASALGLLMILVGGYYVLFWKAIILKTASGIDHIPNVPDMADVWDDIIKPYLSGIFTLIICYLPAVLILEYTGSKSLFWIAFAACTFYLPMAWLAVVMHNNMMALNPVFIVRSITKVFGPYLLAFIGLVLVFAATEGLEYLFMDENAPLAAIYISGLFSLYFMMVVMRILGLIYKHNKDELGWFQSY